MADEMDGFGDDGDFDGFGDDGFGDDATGAAGGADEMDGFGDDAAFEDAVEEVAGAFASLPTPSSPIAADPAPEEEAAPSAAKLDAPVSGEKSGWMKMLVTKKGMLKAILKKTWKERWFVLKDGKLVMSDNPGDRVEEGKKKETLEMLNIKHVEKEEAGDGCKFSIISKTGSYFFFTCRSSRDAKEWKDSIEFAKADITKFSGKGKGGGNSAMLF